MDTQVTEVSNHVDNWLKKEIAHHRTWRSIWSVAYFSNAAATVIAGALTTAAAGLFQDAPYSMTATTWLAAITTILASLEKVLRLREKWDLHRNVQVALELIDMRRASGLVDTRETVALIEQASQLYTQQLSELNSQVNLKKGVGDGV